MKILNICILYVYNSKNLKFTDIMLIKSENTKKFENSKSCKIYDYDFGWENISLFRTVIDGRYPETWIWMNRECSQIYYCIGGKGKILTEKWEFEIEVGDLYYFQVWEKYFVIWEWFEVLVINNPKFDKNQYDIL